MWYPRHFLALPDEALDDMAEIYNECEALVAMPVQALLNLIALILKPQGGDRPIALTALWYALWTRIRQPYMKEW